MNLSKKIGIFIFLLAFGTSFAATANAQIPNSVSGVEIDTEPTSPKPSQTVTVRVQSYITDLNGAQINWYANNKAVPGASGVGKTKYTFTAPENGGKVVISALITTVEGRRIEESVTIQPNTVDLIVETSGYTPPFYLGKPVLAYQNLVKVVAIPHFIDASGNRIDPKKLIYTWKKDVKAIQDQSGYGKQSVIIAQNIVPRPYSISVSVSSADGKMNGSADLYFEDAQPSILFYEDDALYGTLFNTALNNQFRMKNRELSVLAAPFGFNVHETAFTNYVWGINSSERPDLGNKRGITLRVKDDADGSSSVSLNIQNEESILQGALASFTAYYSAKAAESGSNNTFTNPF